ncbi:MAG: LemA family protein [Rubritepida sp.]|jgi:LemA protein|nr:LemA family protein [Rubritepida sp.]
MGVLTGVSVVVLVLGLAAVALLGVAVALYNALVRARAHAEEGWSGVDVQLQRRADLVPMLVQVVGAHAAHEKALLEEIAARRAAAIGTADRAARASAEQGLTESLGRLLAVAEAYPTLTADRSFLNLQTELASIEEALQDARRYYNATARELNVRVEAFPSFLLARSFGFGLVPFFDAGDDARLRAPPQVTLPMPGAPGAA